VAPPPITYLKENALVSKNVAVFVDVANLYYAARGQDVDVDYVALLKHATKGRDLIRAYAYSGLDPENENQKKFLDFLGKNGYRVVAKDIRKFGDGRVKANLDIELVVDLFRLADRMDVAVIVSGDGDFAPAIRALQDEGVRCEVISFKPNTSSDLFAVADEFVDVMKISAIGRDKASKGVGAPEMPAKEVNPDVGFREASPAVAAAAIAAARGNGDEPAGRTRGRGAGRRTESGSRSTRGRTRSTTDETAAAPPAPAAARAEDDAGSAEGRRRRRRGGRGRGRRGRRGVVETAEAEAAPAEPAEIQWEEVDSLEELEGDGLGAPSETEIGFEEADAATLAELGLTAAPGAATQGDGDEPAPEEAPAPKRRSRAAGGKTATSATRAKAAAAKKPASRAGAKSPTKASTTSRAKGTKATKADAEPTGAAEGTAEPAKPRRTRSTKASAKAAPPEAGVPSGSEPAEQGIWQRFTSGRGSRKRPSAEPPAEG
jgi:uncharacterized LabA/DUF88 family protein